MQCINVLASMLILEENTAVCTVRCFEEVLLQEFPLFMSRSPHGFTNCVLLGSVRYLRNVHVPLGRVFFFFNFVLCGCPYVTQTHHTVANTVPRALG